MTVEAYKERAERGAALLDKRKPGWRDRVSTTWLDVSSVQNCPLGQTYGHYSTGKKELFGSDSWEETTAHGFTVSKSEAVLDLHGNYKLLTEAWKVVLSA